MSLDKLKSEIRQLPYSDMKTLARELTLALKLVPHAESADAVAEALVTLPLTKEQAPSMEDKYFRKAFKRKRAISIVQEPKGWNVNCAAVPGASAAGTDLRECVSRVLDTIVGLKALE